MNNLQEGFINVAVLFGGDSVEHEVSIISAVQAMASMDKTKYNIIPVYIAKTAGFTHLKACWILTPSAAITRWRSF